MGGATTAEREAAQRKRAPSKDPHGSARHGFSPFVTWVASQFVLRAPPIVPAPSQ